MNVRDIESQIIGYGKLLLKHHVLIVALLLLAAMAYTVFTINQIMSGPSDESYRSEQQTRTTSTTFDQKTISSIEALKTPPQAYDLRLPSGRVSPFAE